MATPLIKVAQCSVNVSIESLVKVLVRMLILPSARRFRTAVVLSYSVSSALFYQMHPAPPPSPSPRHVIQICVSAFHLR